MSQPDTFMDAFYKSQSKHVVVDQVWINGLVHTNMDTVVFAGKNVMNASTVEELISLSQEAVQKLQQLGIFKQVDVTIDEADNAFHDISGPHHIEVIFNVKESSRLQGTGGVELGNTEADLKTTVTTKNFLYGKAEKLTFQYSVGMKYPSYLLHFSQPVNGNPDKIVSVSVSSATQNYEKQSSHLEAQKGAELGYSTYSRYGTHKLSYEAQWRQVFNIPRQASFKVREEAGHSLKSAIKHSLSYDTRNDFLLPSKGKLIDWTLELAGLGGDAKFIKNTVQSQYYKSFFNGNITLAGSLWGGLLNCFDTNKSRINDRFFLGGPNSLRGFTLRGIGPRHHDASLGGDAFVAAGAHVYSNIPLQSLNSLKGNLKLHGFINSGSIVPMEHDKLVMPQLGSLFQLENIRHCIGVGIVLKTSQANLEINYCKPFSSFATDSVNKGWQFGIGFSFL